MYAGTVFVQDSEQQPLMPASPDEARALLYNRSATMVDHPALNIVQVSSPSASTVQHPVIVGIRLHVRAASLLVFSERTGATPLLHLAVTYQPISTTRARTERQEHYHEQLKLVSAVLRTLTALRPILPISHVITANPEATVPQSAVALLLRHLVNSPYRVIDAHETDVSADDDLLSLYTACARTTSTTDVAVAPTLAYCWFFSQRPPLRFMVQVQDGAQRRIGVIHGTGDDFSSMIDIPIAVRWECVTWECRSTNRVIWLRSWPLSQVTLLPLIGRQTLTVDSELNYT